MQQYLPPEVQFYILSFLDLKDISRCSLVCTLWSEFLNENTIWIRFCKKQWENKQNKKLTAERERQLRSNKVPFKILYIEAELDSVRSIFYSDQELCEIKWEFIFNHGYYGNQLAVFHSDRILRIGKRKFKWKFVSHKGDNDGTEKVKIQVEEFEPLTITRSADDWGWIMKNNYVILKSMDENYFKSKKSSFSNYFMVDV